MGGALFRNQNQNLQEKENENEKILNQPISPKFYFFHWSLEFFVPMFTIVCYLNTESLNIVLKANHDSLEVSEILHLEEIKFVNSVNCFCNFIKIS